MWSRCLTIRRHNKKCLSHLSLTAEQALKQIKYASIVTASLSPTIERLIINGTELQPLLLQMISFGTFLASFPHKRNDSFIVQERTNRDTHPAALSVSGWRSLLSPCETVRGRLCLRSWERGRSHWGQVPWALYWPTETWGAFLCSVQLGCSMGSYRCVLRELHLEEKKGWLERGKTEEREN